MKVLFVGYRGNPYCGGQGIYIYHLSRELSKLGVEVDVLVGPPYPDEMEWSREYRLENLNIWSIRTRHFPLEKLKRVFRPWNFMDYLLTRFHIFPEMQTFSMRAFFFLRKHLKKNTYDIIHDIQTLGWGMIPMKAYGIPMVTTVHHPLVRDRDADLAVDKTFWEKMTTLLFYPLMMQRIVIRRLHRTITSSQEGVKELQRAFGLKESKLSVVYNGMDVQVFKNTGEPRMENTLLFVGNTEDHKKGLPWLLETMTLLPENVQLLIVDEGPPKKLNAAKLINKYGLESRVTILGRKSLEELVSLYSRATILVMSSLYEGFGLPAAEAMACETPVVVTEAGSLPEVVIHNETGLLVPPRDSGAMAKAVEKLLADKTLRERMGRAGRKRAENNFAWPAAAKNTLQVYRSVLEERGRL